MSLVDAQLMTGARASQQYQTSLLDDCYFFVLGRRPLLPWHEFRDSRDYAELELSCSPYHPVWDGHADRDEKDFIHWVCNHCGITKHAALRLWVSEVKKDTRKPFIDFP